MEEPIDLTDLPSLNKYVDLCVTSDEESEQEQESSGQFRANAKEKGKDVEKQ